MIKWKPDCRSRKQKRKNNPALWLVYSSASASDSDNLVFTWSWAERKCRSRKRSRKKMEPFWFFWLRFRRAYDSAYDSDFWFSLGHKRSYDSAYDSDSDSVASENQPLDWQNLSHIVPNVFKAGHFDLHTKINDTQAKTCVNINTHWLELCYIPTKILCHTHHLLSDALQFL